MEKQISLADNDPETARFDRGILVLPVEYTKGLEFDAVLLYDPSKEKYPWEDGYVKLLYVAATRALHELAVVHGEDLTDLIEKPVPAKKQMEILEGKKQDPGKAADGKKKEKQPRRRGHYPVRAEEKTEERRKEASSSIEEIRLIQKAPRPLPVNPSPRGFGDIPDTQILRSLMEGEKPGPGEGEILEVKKSRACLTLRSRYGTLRLTPLGASVIRVQFIRGKDGKFPQGCWDSEPETAVAWSARAGKNTVKLPQISWLYGSGKRRERSHFSISGERSCWKKIRKFPEQQTEDPGPGPVLHGREKKRFLQKGSWQPIRNL